MKRILTRNNLKQNGRSVSVLALAVFFALLILSACGKPGGSSADVSPTPTATPAPTPTPKPPVRERCRVVGTPGLLDLKEFLLPEVTEEIFADVAAQEGTTGTADGASGVGGKPGSAWKCAAAAIVDETELVLVFTSGEKLVQAAKLDIDTGILQPYLEPIERQVKDGAAEEPSGEQREEAQGGPAEDINTLRILSADPLIISDEANAAVYRPEAAEGVNPVCLLDEDVRNGTIRVMNSGIYICTWSGFLYRLADDGSSELVWTLPAEFAWSYPEAVDDPGRLTLRTALREDYSRDLTLVLDPDTFEYEVFEKQLDEPSPDAASDHVLCVVDYESQKRVSLYDREEMEQKTLTLPKTVTNAPASGGAVYLEVPDVPICDDVFVFDRTLQDGYLINLYYWDTENVQGLSWEETEPVPYEAEYFDYGALSERVAEMEERYGVKIYIGENAQTDFSTYTALPSTENWTITAGLDTLDWALSKFPDGFFAQLKDGMYREILFHLVGPMTPRDAGENIQGPSAVTFDESGIVQMAFDINMGLTTGTVCHELLHVLDYKMEDAGKLDEEAWAALNPEGFDYYYSYIDENGNDHQYDTDLIWTAESSEYWSGIYDNIYFIDNYSKTYPTEDRARIFEMLCESDWPDPCFAGPHMKAKAELLFSMIRSAFDTSSWPEMTSWEETLSKA